MMDFKALKYDPNSDARYIVMVATALGVGR